VFTDS